MNKWINHIAPPVLSILLVKGTKPSQHHPHLRGVKTRDYKVQSTEIQIKLASL